MEKKDKISKEAANLIESAAEYAGNGDYPAAVFKVEKALEKIRWINFEVFRELHDIGGILEMLSDTDRAEYLPENMKDWLQKTANEL